MIKLEVTKYEEPDLLYDRVILFEKNFIKLPDFKIELKGNLEFKRGTTIYDPNDFSTVIPITFKICNNIPDELIEYYNKRGIYSSSIINDIDENEVPKIKNGRLIGLSGKNVNWIEIYKERMRQDFEKFLDENIK